MIIRRAGEQDFADWAAMRRKLWPDEDQDELESELPDLAFRDPPYFGLIARSPDGSPLGFAEVGVRNYVEGYSGPAAYLEAIWVVPENRRRGIARALLRHAEEWARDQGFGHFGSDAEISNRASHDWHLSSGFQEVERLVVFGKPLG